MGFRDEHFVIWCEWEAFGTSPAPCKDHVLFMEGWRDPKGCGAVTQQQLGTTQLLFPPAPSGFGERTRENEEEFIGGDKIS